MNQDNTDLTHVEDGSVNFEEAGMDSTVIIEVYDDQEKFLEQIKPDDVLELLNLILDDNLDVSANKYGIDSEMYWKVVALRIAAHSFISQTEENYHSFT